MKKKKKKKRIYKKGNDPTKIYIWIFKKKDVVPSSRPSISSFLFFFFISLGLKFVSFEQIEFFKLLFFSSLCPCYYTKYFVRFNRAIYHDRDNDIKIYVILK